MSNSNDFDKARRHFLGFAAAVSGRLAAVGTSASVLLPLSARAHGHERRDDDHGGWFNFGDDHGKGKGNCFLSGTLITTASGDVPVEKLETGHTVTTVDGIEAQIVWIGRTTYRKVGERWPGTIMPIRICRSAIADNVPNRDLYVSPAHALYLDGVLVPAVDLVNGRTILQCAPDSGDLAYFHILLDHHSVIYAEGAPAETFFPTASNWEFFSNFAEFRHLAESDNLLCMTPFAPVVRSGVRGHLRSLALMGASYLFDVEDPLGDAYVRIRGMLHQRSFSGADQD